MAHCTQEGRYLGRILESTVDTTPGGAVMFKAFVALEQIFENGAWADITALDQRTYAGVCIIKKDGNPNKTGVDQLKDALGWAGTDITELHVTDYSQTYVQLQVKKTDDGKYFNGSWLYNANADATQGGTGGGVEKKPEGDIRALQNRHGAALRALSGPPKAAPRPAPAVNRPAAGTVPVKPAG